MLPTDILTNEHRIIEQVLACLEKMVAESLATGKLDQEGAADAVTFFCQFADRQHDTKEETHLFPAIEEGGFPREVGPTGAMRVEHEAARDHVRAMDQARDAASAGEDAALEQFAEHGQALVELLREHIRKEDHCLFPMANQAIDDQRQRELLVAFEKTDTQEVGRQAIQASLEIANRLADRFGVSRAVTPIARTHRPCSCWSYTQLADQKQIIEKQNLLMSRDLEMARQVQRALIPRKRSDVPGLEIAFAYEPVVHVGGDVLDIIPVGGGRELLFVGDVVGHGVRAALAMSAVKAALRSAVKSDSRPGNVLESINDVVREMFRDQVLPQFVTAACCLVDPARATAELALAGHPKPLWFRADCGEVLQVGSAGFPLGLEEAGEFEDTTIALEPGDVLLLFTDGLIEAMNPGQRLYGYRRFEDLVARHGESSAGELLAAVKSDLKAHVGSHAMTDDLALLVVKFTGAASGVPLRNGVMSAR